MCSLSTLSPATRDFFSCGGGLGVLGSTSSCTRFSAPGLPLLLLLLKVLLRSVKLGLPKPVGVELPLPLLQHNI